MDAVNRRSLADRFWEKVHKCDPSECWLWRAGLSTQGYGRMSSPGKSGPVLMAHRVSYEFANGPIPPGLWVLHRCDVPRCVNPAHLFLGTVADNNADKVAKGRHPRGAKHRLAISKSRKARGASSQFRGVSWHVQMKSWRANISINGRLVHLGSFGHEADAAQAYLDALSSLSEGGQ